MLRKFKIFLKIAKTYFLYKIGFPQPLSATFYLTYRCNLKCSYCPFAKKTSFEKLERVRREIVKLGTDEAEEIEVSKKEAKYIIDEIAKQGTAVLSLTGGEPLLRKDLEEIARHAKEKNMILILHTNATLITKERARKIGESFDSVVVSLAGDEKINDQLRGRGNFKKTMNGVKLLKKYAPKIKVNLNFLLCKETTRNIDNILEFSKKNFDSIAFLPGEYFSDLAMNKKEAKKIVSKLKNLKRKYGSFITNPKEHIELFEDHLAAKKLKVKCDAFDLYFAVAPNGDLLGCSMWPYPFGNILKKDLKKLRKEGKKQKGKLLSMCGGCLGTVRVSLLLRQPFYTHFSLLKNLSSKIGLIKK